jgi:SAM-dependent methyltransferase
VGIETLLRMADVETYNTWVYHQIQPYLGHRVLEVGCGIGNMSSYLAECPLLVCVDLLADSLGLVRRKLKDRPNLHTVQGDICADETQTALAGFGFDTAVLLNVLEHIEDDARALAAVRQLLVPEGRLLLLVPAIPALYGTLDRALGHYRRYEPEGLRTLLERGGYVVERLHYMNLVGVVGWLVNSRLLRRQLLPRPQLAVFNVLGPFLEQIERWVRPPLGQSLIAICRKPAA